VAPDIEVAEVVERACGGETDAWDTLVERFSRLVWAVALAHGLSHADAADVSQTTWLRLAENLRRLREPASVGAWLATTARREAQRVCRGHQRVRPYDPCQRGPLDREAPPADGPVVDAEDGIELWRALHDLPLRCHTLLRMLLADPPPSYAEVSKTLDMPIGSIGPRRNRCLEQLRTRVGAPKPRVTHPSPGIAR
jgi:RNA polymerase sigma factor (sigma-70 family)